MSLCLCLGLIAGLHTLSLATVPEWTDQRTLDELKEAAEQGDAGAMTVLGWRYYNGVGVDADHDAARQWWHRGADEGHARSMTRLAARMSIGQRERLPAPLRIDLLRQAAEKGDPLAMATLGRAHVLGEDVPIDEITGRLWLERAAEAGSIAAMRVLAFIEQEGILADPRQARQWALRAIDEASREQRPLEVEDMRFMATMYEAGIGIEPDPDKARQWAMRGAETGDTTSMVLLASIIGAGDEAANADEIVRWYTLAADRQNATAIQLLGYYSLQGDLIEPDPDRGMDLIRRAADLGNHQAMFNLSEIYENGAFGIEQNDALAVEWLKKAAEAGNTGAMIKLANRYRYGIGVPEDGDRMTHWFQRAASLGNPQAMGIIGYFLVRQSDGDVLVGLHWLLKAADRGNAEAMFNIAATFEAHPGLGNDPHTNKWVLRAAEGGYAPAMNVIGARLATGHGVEKDVERGVEWMRRAAELGDAAGMKNLGIAYSDGTGVERDDAQAVHWWQKAAEKGNADAMAHLSQAYARGRGVEADPDEATKWMRKAADAGHEGARQWLEAQEN